MCKLLDARQLFIKERQKEREMGKKRRAAAVVTKEVRFSTQTGTRRPPPLWLPEPSSDMCGVDVPLVRTRRC